MKKFFSIAALALAMSTGVQAQTDVVPNRMIIHSSVASKAYAVDHVDSISFARKEGEVKANVEFLSYEKNEDEGDIVYVKVTRTDPKSTFKIDVLPTNTAKRYDDITFARYFEQQSTSQKLAEDFEQGKLSGFAREFTANTPYTVVTLAYDEYGVPCQVSRANFTTPKVPTVGTPSVTYTIDETTSSSFTLTVTPNKDCEEFYWCQFEKGKAQEQFEQWGPMFGLSSIEAMIKQFSGKPYSEEATNTWNELAPGTDYEVAVLPVDVEGNFGDLVYIYVTTKGQGGEGIAQVTATVGDFVKYEDSYVQTVTFTPNDQTALYHDAICAKDKYEELGGDKWAKEYLMQDIKEDPNWNQYGVDKYPFTATPNTAYYALALAKNAKGEWGPLTKHEFTTGAAPAGVAPAKVVSLPKRVAAKKAAKRTAVVPVKRSLQLVK
ncbi:hypothetical protein [Leyella stercorea]|uniref:hypothetical protein n=1 Tax=Leyella stercorea TaxID=363265 RepID=UPI002FDA3D0C